MKLPLPALAFAVLLSAPLFPASGGVKFEKERLDLKANPEDSTLVAEFPFTNESKEPLRIMELRTSCGCLSAVADKDEYAAGDKGTIIATFDLGRFTGEEEKAINVRTSEKENAEYRLVVGVEIPEVFVVEPDLLEWEVGEEAKTKSFRIKVPHKDPIHIITIAPSRENFQYELIENEAGRDYEIKLTPVSTESPMLGVLKITTDCKIEKHRRQLAFFSIARPKPASASPPVKKER
jgi:hypothetical protein